MQNDKFDNCYFLIPARKGSKGFPGKNVALFDHTAKTIPAELLEKVFVSTDDELIKDKSLKFNFNVVDRPVEYARDDTSLKGVLEHFIRAENISGDAKIILLYLTYPERTWNDIVQIYKYFLEERARSLICCEDVIDHPYLCFYSKDNNKAELIIDHALYRRQDYPKCFRQSMFFCCFEAEEVAGLHENLFNKDTTFYKLQNRTIDVDYEGDYLNAKNKNNC